MTQAIYAITHKESGRTYVGSSVNVEKRLRVHRCSLNCGTHKNVHLQSAWAKYGEAAFDVRIVEVVSDRALLIEREQVHLDDFQPNVYNLATNVERPTLGQTWSASHRAKFIASVTGHTVSAETRAKIGAANSLHKRTPQQQEFLRTVGIGRKHSAETKAQMSAAHQGRICPKSPEHRAKISAALKGRKLSPERIEKVAATHRGRKQSDEWVAKRTAHNYGNKYSLGRKWSEEERARRKARVA